MAVMYVLETMSVMCQVLKTVGWSSCDTSPLLIAQYDETFLKSVLFHMNT